ncbi:MAG: hypothetical protein HFI93_05720 [Lachnospiraceae bacterium]|nr:hypothetical protein [Lachnospiraceae bacterium]
MRKSVIVLLACCLALERCGREIENKTIKVNVIKGIYQTAGAFFISIFKEAITWHTADG